jgi:vacuolar-type H+-ATPase subunit E/Vma4
MSLDRVKTTVLEEAKARAAKQIGDARAEAERLLAESRSADERVGGEAIRDAKLRLDRETTRELERIQHDSRLQILSAKNKAIDEVFRRVGAKIAELGDSDYIAMVGKWLEDLPAEVGGTLRVNPKDEAKFVGGLDALNRNRSGAGVFTKVVADPKVANGAVVDGPDYNIDCTIVRRLNELREASAGDLARVLFGA